MQSTALPWLYGFATNLLRDHVVAEHKRPDVMAKMTTGPGHLGEESVDDALLAAAAMPRVVAAIAALPDDAREVVLLVGVEGLSYQEVAVALGIAVGTVRSRLWRARLELRRALSRSDLLGAPGPASPPLRKVGTNG